MIGIDIVSINRIERIVSKHKDTFLNKFLNKTEIKLVKIDSKFNTHRISGFFAAKEALAKALRCGIGEKISFLDIVIRKDRLNAPEIYLDDKLKKIFDISNIHLSISHDKGYAVACVIIEHNKKDNINQILTSIYISTISNKILHKDLFYIANTNLNSLKKITLLNLKSPHLALFLSILFGLFGLDRFYIKDYKRAILKIILSPIFILWLIDIALISNDTKKSNFKKIKDYIDKNRI